MNSTHLPDLSQPATMEPHSTGGEEDPYPKEEGEDLHPKKGEEGEKSDILERMLQLGTKYAQAGNGEMAVVCYRTVGRLGNPIGYHRLGIYYEEQGEVELARTTFRKAGLPNSYYNLALTYSLEPTDPTSVEQMIQAYLQSKTKSAYNNLGVYYDNHENRDQAIYYYDQAIALGSKLAFKNRCLGLSEAELPVFLDQRATPLHLKRLFELGEEEGNPLYYERALQLGCPRSALALGRYYQNQGEEELMLRYFLLDGSKVAYHILGEYYTDRDSEKMLYYYHLAQDKVSDNSIGSYYFSLGQLEKARTYFESAAAQGDSTAIYNLHLYLERGERVAQIQRAAQLGNNWALLDLIEMFPDEPSYLHQLFEVDEEAALLPLANYYSTQEGEEGERKAHQYFQQAIQAEVPDATTQYIPYLRGKNYYCPRAYQLILAEKDYALADVYHRRGISNRTYFPTALAYAIQYRRSNLLQKLLKHNSLDFSTLHLLLQISREDLLSQHQFAITLYLEILRLEFFLRPTYFSGYLNRDIWGLLLPLLQGPTGWD